ncbi:peroxiredoxin [Sphingobium jiangsuense]|uniref:Peroxiredoxin n=1 Tax=Sphingobium jiangsuense TaxID=870476 RepID=A0A7W6BKX6_9SPHN|nr:peroxiredoxin-like family protein [Sphingobium jiangsuense]MBB3924593.1 peroxiredoxin [Sphingobium jiangsuense]GLT01711.1 peroxiredoxin [Sphingobium jiangsuense]
MTQKGLNQRFAELDAERKRSWTPEAYARNAGQREALVKAYAPENHAQAGDRIAPFTLIDAEGKPLTDRHLLATGPAVLIFFRFGGCPACNIALPYYNETLWPALRKAGIPLVAVSPQTPVDPGPAERHRLGFPIASDPGYALGRALGITFLPEEQPKIAPGDAWIGATLGTDSYELPQPTVVVLNRDGTIRFIDVSPDWLIRTESTEILAQLPEADIAGDEAA